MTNASQEHGESKDGLLARRELFFHEDDYSLIELVLPDNQEAVEEEMDEIARFAEEHQAEAGYTALYVREKQAENLSALDIRLTDVTAAVSAFAQPYDGVSTGYGATYRVECPDIQAFGPNEETVLLCEHDDGTLRKMWLILEFDDRKRYDWTLKLLRTLAGLTPVPLALADWTWGVHVALEDEAALTAYLDQYVDEDTAS